MTDNAVSSMYIKGMEYVWALWEQSRKGYNVLWDYIFVSETGGNVNVGLRASTIRKGSLTIPDTVPIIDLYTEDFLDKRLLVDKARRILDMTDTRYIQCMRILEADDFDQIVLPGYRDVYLMNRLCEVYLRLHHENGTDLQGDRALAIKVD